MLLLDSGMVKAQEFPSFKQERHKDTSEGTTRECVPYSTM